MNILINYCLFLAKIITFFVIFAGSILLFFKIIKRKKNAKGELTVTLLEDNYKNIKEKVFLSKMKKFERKAWLKKNKEEEKYLEKNNKYNLLNNEENYFKKKKKTLYVLDFKGDVYAKQVSGLRREISAILSTANKNDEVLLRLESAGGVVHGYGLAASQLNRLRKNGIRLIVSVDKIAASGGYMMACVADHIIAAPFAILGSIGVIGQIPNFNKLLKKCHIDVELHTAGEYKRTLTMFGNNTESTRKKFCEELNIIHNLFKNFVKDMRPCLDIDKIADGDHWFGTMALDKKLIDEISTSDDFLISRMEHYTLLNIKYVYNKTILNRFTSSIVDNISKTLLKLFFSKNYF